MYCPWYIKKETFTYLQVKVTLLCSPLELLQLYIYIYIHTSVCVCVCCEGQNLRFPFSLKRSCSSTICWNDFPFHIVLTGCYSSKIYVLCLGVFYYSSAIKLSIIIPVPYDFNYYSFIVGFEVRQFKFTKYSTFKKLFLLIF